MKGLLILVVVGAIILALWKSGFVEEFLGPWKGWANWIGYFQ